MIKVKEWDKYWKLTIIKEIEWLVMGSWYKARRMECLCDCWNRTQVSLWALRSKAIISCWYVNRKTKKDWTKSKIKYYTMQELTEIVWYKFYIKL